MYLSLEEKAIHIETKRLAKIMSIYFRSSMGIDFPKAPYLGQVHYDFDLKRTFRYEEKDFGDCILKSTIDWFHWVDITGKDL